MPRQKSAEAIVGSDAEGPNDDTESSTTDLVIDRDDRSTVRSGGLAAGDEPEARRLSRGVEVDPASGGRTKKRPRNRARQLRQRGLDEVRAWRSAVNGRGPWWNAGASHVSVALPNAFFTGMGLASLVGTRRRLQCAR
jgi:hypothetical protein